MGIKSDALKMADRKHMTNTSDFAGDPYAHLAAAIIIKAFEDLRDMNGTEKFCIGGSMVSKEELITFFCSRWCECLLSFQSSIHQNDVVREALKICE